MKRVVAVAVACCAACGGASRPQAPARTGHDDLSLAGDDRMVTIPGGRFIAGSTPEERATAYDDYVATAGNDTARTEKWFDREADRHVAELPAFRIDMMPVTQAQFGEFIAVERIPAPTIDEAGWAALGVPQDFATAAPRFVWRDGRPPDGREEHPVVLVSWQDADRYCRWRGALRGEQRRLPSAAEFEKASRGDGGMPYPWGGLYDPDKLNSAAKGPADTTPVGAYPAGASPFGLLDMAGNVLQWTSTPADGNTVTLKGSSWRSFGGIGRGASFDQRPKTARDVLVGFRCAADAP